MLIKLEIWLETAGVALSPRLTRILLQRDCEDQPLVTVWQLDPFDELISMQIPINTLRDCDIAIGCEISGIDGEIKGSGSIKVFGEQGVLKSGLLTLMLNGNGPGSDAIPMMEDRLYRRKSKQVPTWHVQLMKERLKREKEAFFTANPGAFVVNFIIPITSHPLKLRDDPSTMTRGSDELCTWDVIESQEDSNLRRRFPKLFSATSAISNGDLRAIHGILQRGFDNSAVDSSNLLWTRREYLAKHFPSALVPFVQSVQWWLLASDPTEIDEALRMIEGWRLPVDAGEREEICAMLLVKMSKIPGLTDSPSWMKLFERLLPENFVKNYQSPLILFLTAASSAEMPELRGFLLRAALFSAAERDVGIASEIYWRLKVSSDDRGLFREYSEGLGDAAKNEIGKQERLFGGIDQVLLAAQRLKGPRAAKLELLKKLLGDPEASDIPSALQSNPLLPGLQNCSKSSRVEAVVPERSNLFKSTAFTVLLVFLRHEQTPHDLSLPIIFKRGDDLTRDASCLRIFRAIWDIWQRDGGLELFPRRLLYGVVPLGTEFGMVEFVESVPLSRVIEPESAAASDTSDASHADEWAVSRYLKDLPDPSGAKGNFLASCVGFSLLTYLLGIGDRHLDNLLLTPQGHLLHIDFSFLFGADPKPFPPPIKITREMVRGFEEAAVTTEAKWAEFKGLCFTALTLLRRKSALILSLLESEYPAAAKDCDFVKDRLAALVSQAEALQKMDRLLEESRRAMFPQVMETIHKWVQYWKS